MIEIKTPPRMDKIRAPAWMARCRISKGSENRFISSKKITKKGLNCLWLKNNEIHSIIGKTFSQNRLKGGEKMIRNLIRGIITLLLGAVGFYLNYILFSLGF